MFGVHRLCFNPALAVVFSAKADEDVGAPDSETALQQLARALAVWGSVKIRPPAVLFQVLACATIG
jgi:hypothetical protein